VDDAFDSLEYESTPLHYACFGGHVKVVSELLAAGAQIESRDRVKLECDQSD
jgi:ankyrin repeat protein